MNSKCDLQQPWKKKCCFGQPECSSFQTEELLKGTPSGQFSYGKKHACSQNWIVINNFLKLGNNCVHRHHQLEVGILGKALIRSQKYEKKSVYW